MKQKDRTVHNGRHSTEIQPYGTVIDRAISLDDRVRSSACEKLNQILADTITLRDMYKKHHWQVTGPTFYQLHLLFDKHFGEQVELVDELAERIQTLGGVAIAMAHDVAETTRIERPPRGRENPNTQLFRLLQAHEQIIAETREAADWAGKAGDQGTNDLLISNVLRTNELQVWFITEQFTAVGVEGRESEEAAEAAGSGHRRGHNH
ncbi:MAG TPA: DNA starvation/stationary phase protection protein [Bryobacteraceae bacterium]|jgi:starvation-inducible DNA-binding protein|nr:DNA starvation/stationary phase protection protein [Bryobacteraceae bacterium]